jgi:hypothetical protein
VLEQARRIDVLVNNAGAGCPARRHSAGTAGSIAATISAMAAAGSPPVAWQALAAPRQPVPVAEGHRPGVAAGPAALAPRAADTAVPILAPALHDA